MNLILSMIESALLIKMQEQTSEQWYMLFYKYKLWLVMSFLRNDHSLKIYRLNLILQKQQTRKDFWLKIWFLNARLLMFMNFITILSVILIITLLTIHVIMQLQQHAFKELSILRLRQFKISVSFISYNLN